MQDKDLLVALTLAFIAGGVVPSSLVVGAAIQILEELKKELDRL